jgi:cytochrome c oxidase subunit 2
MIKVKKGDKVKITFQNSEGFHDWVVSEFGAATKQTKAPTTEVIEFVADKTGNFEYYCSVGKHREMGMKGTLVVE